MEEVTVTIIGAGIVGLAIAAEIAGKTGNVVVVEKNVTFGLETSSRNSEVIHSGIYYTPGSLKAALCVEGAQRMYALCERHAIPFKKTGKLIVAMNQNEIASLESLYRNGVQNNVPDLHMIDAQGMAAFHVRCRAVAALYSPHTGIVSSHAVMKHCADYAQSRGATIAYNSNLISIQNKQGLFELTIEEDNYTFASRIVINCAGLSSDKVAEMAGLDIDKKAYRLNYCKGSYFHYTQHYPLPVLIYPVPEKKLTGLGIHATIDLAGRLRFGPDAEYVSAINYDVDAGRCNMFFESASGMLTGLDCHAFQPDMAGIRPKLSGPGDGVRDFVIADEADEGLPGLINLIGIESPGLSSSLAIARMVGNMVQSYL